MGKLDDMAKELYENDLVFADTMNVLFFDGESMIRAQDLSPLDPTEEHTIFDDDFVSITESEEKRTKRKEKQKHSAIRNTVMSYVCFKHKTGNWKCASL